VSVEEVSQVRDVGEKSVTWPSYCGEETKTCGVPEDEDQPAEEMSDQGGRRRSAAGARL